MNWNAQIEVVVAVALAMVLGGLVGVERELADKPAGLRTHMLVAGAAALLVGLGNVLLLAFNLPDPATIRSDPIRVVEAVITGISFLGAGTIFRRDKEGYVEGLTTAASLLMSGGIGISIALHQYITGIGVTLLTLFVLRGVKYLENWIRIKKNSGKPI